MKEFQYVITDAEGIHARPAGLLVKKAKEFASTITIKKDDKSGDAKKTYSAMGLAAKKGETVTICVEGADEDAAARALEALFKKNL